VVRVKMVFPTPTTIPQGIGSPFNTKGTSSRETRALVIEMAKLQATFNQKGEILGMVIE
jgi:hypothetical protein